MKEYTSLVPLHSDRGGGDPVVVTVSGHEVGGHTNLGSSLGVVVETVDERVDAGVEDSRAVEDVL